MIADTAKVSLFDGTHVNAMEIYPGHDVLSFGHKALTRARVVNKRVQNQTDVIGLLLNNGQKLVGSRDQKVAVHRKQNIVFLPMEKIDIGERLRGEKAGMPVILNVIGLVFYPRTAVRVVGLELDHGKNFVAESVLCR